MKTDQQFLTLTHYKEPLKAVTDGFGYFGAVQVTVDGTKIQCHVCGELFETLWPHIMNRHPKFKKARDYKEYFGLAYETSLISEDTRARMKQRTLNWLGGMTAAERSKFMQKVSKKSKEWHKNRTTKQPKHQLETKNKRGTCPDQLLQTIKKAAEDIGHTPTKPEFIEFYASQRYIHLIYKTFGSYKTAVKMAGLTPERDLVHEYSKEELIEYLKTYYKNTGKIPTATDCRRNLIPSTSAYIRHFGGLPNARKMAGIQGNPKRGAPKRGPNWEKNQFYRKSKSKSLV